MLSMDEGLVQYAFHLKVAQCAKRRTLGGKTMTMVTKAQTFGTDPWPS